MGVYYTKENLSRIFGLKFINRGWRKKDREYNLLKKEINEVILEYIAKTRENILDKGKKKYDKKE